MNDEIESDNSSLEIYLTLTEQLSEEDLRKQRIRMLQEKQSQQYQKQQMAIMPRQPQKLVKVRPIERPRVIIDVTDETEPTVTYFDNMVKEFQRKEAFIRSESDDGEILDDLIRVEEIFIASMIAKMLKLCPSAFENEITKEEIMNLITRASRFLWTNVGATLEHYLLWWAVFPMACRPVSCAKYLREYLMLIQPDDAPEPILSTLKSLGEILTVHAGKCSGQFSFELNVLSQAFIILYKVIPFSYFSLPFISFQSVQHGTRIFESVWCCRVRKLMLCLIKIRSFMCPKSK